MKNFILLVSAILSICLIPNFSFAQYPVMGTTANFSVFTAAGAFTNLGASDIIGNIGTGVGELTGFPPGTVHGNTHVADPVAVQAASDVQDLYTDLVGRTCGPVLPAGLGNGQILLPNVYCIGTAATLNGNLILDAGGDPNALFIIKIDGALITGINSNVVLEGSANISNVFWQVNGLFTLGDGSIFQGTIVTNGAINLLEASTLYGRALSRIGAISTNNNIINTTGLLAIMISELSAINKADKNYIYWKTASETSRDWFEIERSTNGTDFYKIGSMPAKGQIASYSFIDVAPENGPNQYRLLLKELNGSINYSRIVTANYQSNKYLRISTYPNPATEQTSLYIQGKMASNPTLMLSDMNGMLLRKMTVTNNKMQLNLLGIKSGLYQIRYLDSERALTIKIIKQ